MIDFLQYVCEFCFWFLFAIILIVFCGIVIYAVIITIRAIRERK